MARLSNRRSRHAATGAWAQPFADPWLREEMRAGSRRALRRQRQLAATCVVLLAVVAAAASFALGS